MIVGAPREIKNHEYRVGMASASMRRLATAGHQGLSQSGAGTAAGLKARAGQVTHATVATALG